MRCRCPAAGPTSTAPDRPDHAAPRSARSRQQITALETEVASLGEQLKTLAIERQQVQGEVDLLTSRAGATLPTSCTRRETAAETAAEDAYKSAAGLPPGAIGSDLHGLGSLSRLQTERPAGLGGGGAAAQAGA